jgi:hypothetical protein
MALDNFVGQINEHQLDQDSEDRIRQLLQIMLHLCQLTLKTLHLGAFCMYE